LILHCYHRRCLVFKDKPKDTWNVNSEHLAYGLL
jgi:hypothetical protein